MSTFHKTADNTKKNRKYTLTLSEMHSIVWICKGNSIKTFAYYGIVNTSSDKLSISQFRSICNSTSKIRRCDFVRKIC
nr:MAG TPA: hypothetical protein [Caudoviricetes sp.]